MTPSADGEETPGARLAAIYRLAGQRDWAAVEARCHPAFTVVEPPSIPYGGEWKGRDALRRVAEAMYGTWASARVTILDIAGGAEWGVVVVRLEMTSKRTGRTFAQTICEAGRFEDGLLRELRIHYFDTAEVAAEA